MAASERERLILSDCETLRLHYYYTIREWYERTKASHNEIVAAFDERLYRLWLFYLAGAMTMFNEASMVNYQLQYIRNRRALPITRDYMFESERKLRSMEAAPERPLAAE
jgi:cyclopropane-fatty-acyl-phospholipid synthase